MTIQRAKENPILAPADISASKPYMEVIGVFNAGVIRFREEVLLLLRVAERPINNISDRYLIPVYDEDSDELQIISIDKHDPLADFSDSRVIKTPRQNYLTSISHLRLARSKDGVCFRVDEHPAVYPSNRYESYGIEDPRITQIGKHYYITYSGISELGIVTSLLETTDFISYRRRGNIFHPDNKDVVIFPEQIHGKYYALHRPSCSHYGKPDMWIAESSDLVAWGNHRQLMGVREGLWDEGRIGASAVPVLIEEGWLEIYHGADNQNRYCVGAVLLDKDEPWKVIARSKLPVMVPELPYEMDGFFGNVIFPCGLLLEESKVKLYYGASDTYVAYVELTLDHIKDLLFDQ